MLYVIGDNNNKQIMKKSLIIISLLSYGGLFASEAKITRDQYVEQWSETAVQEMFQNGIPASITLAQGVLESASGNSELARKGNNHFGIKCHGWTGDKMYVDDDAKGECFRVYSDASESYVDHSEFLKKYERYAFLFTYDTDDYESWAKGLKKAGYATDPSYPQRLITIIEDLNLANYDKVAKPEIHKEPSLIAGKAIRTNNHAVQNKEDLSFVIVKQGDTFYSIAKEFGLTLNQLRRYNDFDRQKDLLSEGEIVYVKHKKGQNLFGKEEYTVSKDCSLLELSQLTGVKASVIQKLNGFDSIRTDLSKGQKIILR